MSRKCEPVAETGAEEYRIVRHTHDIELATRLMKAHLQDLFGCPGDGTQEGFCEPLHRPDCPHWEEKQLGAYKTYVRIIHCLPGSYGESEGWKFEYRECKRGRGAFPAVVFL